jgi:predicted phosphodiesterase
MAAKQEAHELLQDLERVSRELNRIPNRVEYQKLGKFPTQAILDVFGSYQLMLKAAGLSHTRGKVTEQEKRTQAFEHLKKEITEKKIQQSMPLIASKLMVLSDLHSPVNHPDAIDFIIELKRQFKPDLVCSVGDEVDLGAFSYHEKDPSLPSPGHELEQAIEILRPLYKEIPRMIIAESNHGSLIHRKAKTAGLPVRVLKSYREVLDAPEGWEWRFEIQVQFPDGDKCLIHHSYGSNALLAAQRRGVSTITGHTHTQQSISFWQNLDKTYFAMVVGCLVDETSMAMSYSKNNVGRPLLGCGVVESGQPKIARMILDKFGRWVGKIFL